MDDLGDRPPFFLPRGIFHFHPTFTGWTVWRGSRARSTRRIATVGAVMVQPLSGSARASPLGALLSQMYVQAVPAPSNNFPQLATEIFPEEGAAKLAAHLNLTATGLSSFPRKIRRRHLRELWSELVPGEFEDHSHPGLWRPFMTVIDTNNILVRLLRQVPPISGVRLQDSPYHCMLIGVSEPLLREISAQPPRIRFLVLLRERDVHGYKSHMQPLSKRYLSGQLKDWLRESAARCLETLRPKPGTSCRCQECLNLEVQSQRALSNVLTETFDRYAAQHDVKMTTRFECARCQTMAYCCKAHQKRDWRSKSREQGFRHGAASTASMEYAQRHTS
ncbi:hypothetical protein B0H13DRAFT_1861935 [Mycena leptocephala]|nr:hypothetical protein B0H13DRAFT_1861935 [Mycena leptocephala]